MCAHRSRGSDSDIHLVVCVCVCFELPLQFQALRLLSFISIHYRADTLFALSMFNAFCSGESENGVDGERWQHGKSVTEQTIYWKYSNTFYDFADHSSFVAQLSILLYLRFACAPVAAILLPLLHRCAAHQFFTVSGGWRHTIHLAINVSFENRSKQQKLKINKHT